jgi:hypothetical protein
MQLDSRFLVCGLAREVQHSVSSEIARLSRALEGFSEVHYYVVESDSKDRTIKKLEELENSEIDFKYE